MHQVIIIPAILRPSSGVQGAKQLRCLYGYVGNDIQCPQSNHLVVSIGRVRIRSAMPPLSLILIGMPNSARVGNRSAT